MPTRLRKTPKKPDPSYNRERVIAEIRELMPKAGIRSNPAHQRKGQA